MELEKPKNHPPPRSWRGPRAFGVVLFVFSLFLIYNVTLIREGGGFMVVGPRVFPTVIVGFLTVLSAIFLLRTTVWPDVDLAETAGEERAATHWPTVIMTGLVLVAYPFAMRELGYIIGTALFLPITANIFGSKRPLRDVVIGIVLAITVYLVFTRVLSVRLPAGLLAPIL